MVDATTLMAFTGAVVILLLSPGPNMIFVLSHGATYGAQGGLSAALGIALADVALTATVATGLGLMVSEWPELLDIVRYAGAAYLIWMAASALRARQQITDGAAISPRPGKVLIRAAANALLNPKALLFFLTFLPAFVDPSGTSLASQLWILGLWLTVIALIFHIGLGLIGAHMSRGVTRLAAGHTLLQWLHAAVLAGLAAWVVFA